MRLLVVEDDPDLNRQLTTALSDAGYVVDRAFDGEEGHFLGDSEPYDAVVLDIGPQTVKLFSDEIAKARTIVWNGPLGMFEKRPFAQGTLGIASAVAAATRNGATSIIGGGDSVAAVEQAGVASQISHISTGGGASLEFLAGDKLPGVEALTNAATGAATNAPAGKAN